MEAGGITASGGRSILERSPGARLPDRLLRWGLTALAAAVLVLLAYFFLRLIGESQDVFNKEGVFGYVFGADWAPGSAKYGALPLLVGTLITSGIALLIGVPIAVATALFLTELCPRRLRSPLTILVELLAAVPSVVYGLWGFFVLIPKLKPIEQWFSDTFSFLPFVSAISREVIATVPPDHKEAALALGATRWEMIRTAILPYSRPGISGAAMLGLGRAIGETIAVTIVIGNAPKIGHQIFDQGYTLAAVIANEFGEAASDPLHRSALLAAGLVLFVLTLIVNLIARIYIVRAERGNRARKRPAAGMAG